MPESERSIPAAQHEPTDIGPGFIWGAAALCLGTLLSCALLVLWLYPGSRRDGTLELPLPRYPAPRLQPDPGADLQRLRHAQLEMLNGTGWVDKERGIVHIPIGEAMQDVARNGIAGWPKEPSP